MKIETGGTYITFDESDGVAKEHLGRWKLCEVGACCGCGLYDANSVEGLRACGLAGGACLGIGGGGFVRA